MTVLICGPYLTEEMEMLLPDASPAAGKFLRNLKHGFEQNGCEIEVFSFQSICIPDESHRILFEIIEARAEQRECYTFKDSNILGALKKYRRQIINTVKPGDYVLFYNSVYATMHLQQEIRKRKAHPVLIMADYTGPEEYTSLPRKVVAYLAKADMRRYEKYIVLSKMFLSELGEKRHCLLIQGGIDDAIINSFPEPVFDNKRLIFYYSGFLSAEVGIQNLLDAIRLVDTDQVELMISGKGPMEAYVCERAAQDRRIHYLGYVTNEQYYQYLQKSNVLVNPRDMTLRQNKNNFPSKIMEYIASGRVILSTKFSGWEDFNDCVVFAESSSRALAGKMNQLILEYPKRYMLAYQLNCEKSKQFVWSSQSERIIDFLW